MLGESTGVISVLVARDDGRVAGKSEDRCRFADVAGTADDDEVKAVVGGLDLPPRVEHVAIEHHECRGRRRGHESWRAQRQQPSILGVLGFDVLVGRDRSQDSRLGQVSRKWAQNEDARDLRIDVELGELADHLAECGVAGEPLRARCDSKEAGAPVDAPLVDRRRLVVAHQQRRDANAPLDPLDSLSQSAQEPLRISAAVEPHTSVAGLCHRFSRYRIRPGASDS